jgi:hypothetical protein
MIVHLYRCSTCGKLCAYTQEEHELREQWISQPGGHLWDSGERCRGTLVPFVQFAAEPAR